MKCPNCGAEIQEGAQFCLYCMETLGEKTELKPLARKTHWIAVAVAAVAVAAVLVFFLGRKGETQESAQMQTSLETTQPTTQAALQPLAPITEELTFISNASSATQLLKCENLWQPIYLCQYEQTEQVCSYAVGTSMEGVYLRTHFIDGGVSILTSITALTEESLADGILLANCAINAVYGCNPNAQVYLDESNMYPTQTINAAESSVTVDYALGGEVIERARAELPIGQSQYLHYELHTRVLDGVTYHDIFLFHGQR